MVQKPFFQKATAPGVSLVAAMTQRPLIPGLVTEPRVVARRSKEELKPSASSLISEASTRVSRSTSIDMLQEDACKGPDLPAEKMKDKSTCRRLEKELVLWRQMKADFLKSFRVMRCPETSSSSRTTQADSVTCWTELTSQATPTKLGLRSFDDSSGEEDSDVEILVGPTQLAAYGSSLPDLFLPEDRHGTTVPVPLQSHGQCLSLSDAMRLAKARSSEAPLSFGSVTHLLTRQPLQCRPCMFEQRPGRCRKSYLCDFCHLSHRRRVKVTKATLTSGIWRV